MTGYFDHNATTPLCSPAREAWLIAQADFWQNPSGLYRGAAEVKRHLEGVREAFAEILGCEPPRIVFNSGATEGANVLISHEALRAGPEARVFVSAIEHPCVLEAAKKWFGSGRVTELPIGPSGIVDVDATRRLIAAERPALVSVMAANNETGVLQPWRELAEICRQQGVRFHCDAAQWVGKMATSDFAGCDWATVSGHKFGGPKGVGLLIIPKDSAEPLALHAGGPQESGHRGGTESFADISAMLAALRDRTDPGNSEDRDAFETSLLAAIPGTRLVGAEAPRLPNTSMAVMPAHPNLKWLIRLSERGFAASTGSACSAGRGNPSSTMAAMGLDFDEMGRVLRFSGGPDTDADDWQALAGALADTWTALEQRQRPATKVDLSNL